MSESPLAGPEFYADPETNALIALGTYVNYLENGSGDRDDYQDRWEAVDDLTRGLNRYLANKSPMGDEFNYGPMVREMSKSAREDLDAFIGQLRNLERLADTQEN